MPLVKSSSKPAFKQNVLTLMGEVGKSPHIQTKAQALAIAYETQRRARAMGGVVPGYDIGGGVDPSQQQMPPTPGVMPPQMPGPAPAGVAGPQMGPPPTPGINNAPAGLPAPLPGQPQPPQGQWASGVAQNAAPPANPQNAPPIPPNAAPAEQPMGKQLMASGGGLNMAKAPSLSPPWQTKAEDRRLHIGPVLSNVPGRTDNHQVRVPSSSYVLPAAHISSLGQGNTLAGMSMVTKMFGNPGMPRIVHGPGAPHMRGLAAGGSPDQSYGEPISCDISGGEYVLSPQQIINRFGDIDVGHKALDRWVMETRRREIALQKKLPEPAKS